MRKYLFNIIIICVCLFAGYLYGYINVHSNAYNCFRGCAHLSSFYTDKGYVCISSDKESDVAYYIKVSSVTIKEDAPVVLSTGAKGVVTMQTLDGFLVDVYDALEIEGGISGSAVFNTDAEIIGYVSAQINPTTLYCIVAN